MERGSGCRIRDADGNVYIDYVMSWGPLLLGHAHPEVLAAAREALACGSSFGASTRAEVEFAEAVGLLYPAAEMLRCVSSGTEATMSAIRLARAATKRSKIIKFAGQYHGHSDALLVQAGSGPATLGLPDSPGVPPGAVRDTIAIPWNDPVAVDAAFRAHAGDIAVVICEPVAANMGVVPPARGFLEFLRDITRQHGTLLLFDEVLTGFRIARGSAAAHYGIAPDLVTLGKVIGAGFPLAAFGGRADVMALLAPSGPVYQAGTLSGNPVAVAAGLAQLRALKDDHYVHLENLAERLATGLEEAFATAGVPAVVQRVNSLLSVFFTPHSVRNYAGARAADHRRYARFFHGMLERGHYLPPSGYESFFLSVAHAAADVDATVDAARDTAAGLRGT